MSTSTDYGATKLESIEREIATFEKLALDSALDRTDASDGMNKKLKRLYEQSSFWHDHPEVVIRFKYRCQRDGPRRWGFMNDRQRQLYGLDTYKT